ncbi:unnamed protein product [Schistocephalus solidus]|uniref:RNA-directed RNA polymerase n=1 Tax=Schistocephalus solidus TaxID=70667 RepID=A0A183TJJ9_SCHSO|nr:unnamed protein product [Schistocephalus solidus]
MGKVEKTRLKDTIDELDFYGRYGDDLFCMTDHNTDTNALVRKFNSVHPSLKFSAESEVDNGIAFLDILLQRREDGSIKYRTTIRASQLCDVGVGALTDGSAYPSSRATARPGPHNAHTRIH